MFKDELRLILDRMDEYKSDEEFSENMFRVFYNYASQMSFDDMWEVIMELEKEKHLSKGCFSE